MIGLDTNILVRIITHDDSRQEALARRLFNRFGTENEGFICLAVVSELAWVLERTYGLDRPTIASAFETLLGASDVKIERADLVAASLPLYLAERADLADILIGEINREAGCSTTFTFDKSADRLGSMKLLTDQTLASEP